MSITKEITITIWCDDCSVWEQFDHVSVGNTRIMRSGMKRHQGWTSTKANGVVVDRCPVCSTKAAAKGESSGT